MEAHMTGLTRRATSLVAAIGCALSITLHGAQQGAKKTYDFRGTVEGVDASRLTVTVKGDNVEGWMAAMTMTYKVDKEDVLKQVKAGDQITAKVYDGDFQVLHDVKVAPAKKP
jgi:Cu/Ag efflux protein CusF